MPTTILRPYLLTLKNRYRRSARGAFGLNRDMLLLVVALVIMGCIFAASYLALGAMSQRKVFLAVFPPRLIDVTFFYFFFLLTISNTVAATGNIYTSERMSLLLAAPISSLRLFSAKFVETWIETGLMFYVFTLPAFLAAMIRLELPFEFLFTYLILSVPYLCVPVALGMILATLLSRLISLVWRRGAFFITLVAGVFVYGVAVLSSTLRGIREGGTAKASLVSIAGLYENPNPWYLPSRWISDLLNTFLGAPLPLPYANYAMLIATAIGTGAAAFLVYDILMLRVRSLAGTHTRLEEESLSLKSGDTDATRSLLERAVNLFPTDQQVQAIILKDLTSLLRDRSQALQLLLFLGIATIYVTVFNFMAYGMNLDLAGKQVWYAVLATLNAIFCGFIFTTVLTRLVYPSVSLEGRAFWILQVTPIEILRLIRAKLLCWLPLTSVLLVSLLCSGALVLDPSIAYIGFMFFYGVAVSIGCTGLAIGLGARFASFDWEAPNQIAVSAGTLVLLLIGVIHVLTMTIPVATVNAILFIPGLQKMLGSGTSAGIVAGIMLGILLFNLYIAKVACEGGARSLIKSRGQLV